jgi:hypothetical protein
MTPIAFLATASGLMMERVLSMAMSDCLLALLGKRCRPGKKPM